jgi:RNA polymerase sigma-70 factor (ECF subfamily)
MSVHQQSLNSAFARPPLEVSKGVTAMAPQSMSDADHKARFAQLVRDHQAFVWRSARRLGLPEADVDDAVQEVFLLAARQLDVIEDPRGYLFQTCLYVVGHVRRSARRRRETDDKLRQPETDPRATPEQDAENAEAREQLQTILDSMPDDIRSCFVLFQLEGFKMSEIAVITGAPSGTVASRLRRGR